MKIKRIYTFLCVLLALPFLFSGVNADDQNLVIKGAGASFPNPLYQKWAREFETVSGITVEYQSVGSGAGQKAIKEKQVLFAGSDAPMSELQLNKFGLLQFPFVTGGVVPVINIEGINSGELRLDGDVLARIFLKDIKNWNDPDILELQIESVKRKLPASPINVVVRQDSSGTSWVFTYYLNKTSAFWQQSGIEFGKKPAWRQPDLTGNTNDGISRTVKSNKNTIGYVESAYINKYSLKYPLLKNKAGIFVRPERSSFSKAVASAFWANAPSNFEVDMINLPGEKTWPVVAVTYILIYKNQSDLKKTESLMQFFNYCYDNGAATAERLGYVPIPELGINTIRSKIWKQITCDGKPLPQTK